MGQIHNQQISGQILHKIVQVHSQQISGQILHKIFMYKLQVTKNFCDKYQTKFSGTSCWHGNPQIFSHISD